MTFNGRKTFAIISTAKSIAQAAEQAVALWNAKSDNSPLLAEWMEEHELEGFTFEAGGNG